MQRRRRFRENNYFPKIGFALILYCRLLNSVCQWFLVPLCLDVLALFGYVNCLRLSIRHVMYKHECNVELRNLMRLFKHPSICLVPLFYVLCCVGLSRSFLHFPFLCICVVYVYLCWPRNRPECCSAST